MSLFKDFLISQHAFISFNLLVYQALRTYTNGFVIRPYDALRMKLITTRICLIPSGAVKNVLNTTCSIALEPRCFEHLLDLWSLQSAILSC